MTDLSVQEASMIVTYVNSGMPLNKAIDTVAPRFKARNASGRTAPYPTREEIDRKAEIWDAINKIPPQTLPETLPTNQPKPSPYAGEPVLVPVPTVIGTVSDGAAAGATELGSFINIDIGGLAWGALSLDQQAMVATVLVDQMAMWEIEFDHDSKWGNGG